MFNCVETIFQLQTFSYIFKPQTISINFFVSVVNINAFTNIVILHFVFQHKIVALTFACMYTWNVQLTALGKKKNYLKLLSVNAWFVSIFNLQEFVFTTLAYISFFQSIRLRIWKEHSAQALIVWKNLVKY